MANKSVFSSARGKAAPAANTVNRAGGAAYSLNVKAALAQYAATGTFNDSFYATAEAQVTEVLDVLSKIADVAYIGKVALYARELGRMKDMPALICAHLTTRGPEGLEIFKRIFPTVIDNGRMLRNFFQIIRSGVVGRKNFGTAPKKALASWFSSKRPEDIFKMSVGKDPALADVISLARPTDLGSPERKALYAYLLDQDYEYESLPPVVKEYELLKKDPGSAKSLPKVPLEMLMGMALTPKQWIMLAEQMSWTQLRMNLNTLARHGVLKNEASVKMIASKLSDATLVEKAKPFPYQLFTSYLFTKDATGDDAVPPKILNALHDALEVAAKNVPTFDGQAYIAVDTSGSMTSNPVTGSRAGSTTKMMSIDVAALIACTFLKKNRDSVVMPFDTRLHMSHGLNPNDSIMTNADKLRRFGGGGTDCGLALAHLNQTKAKGDLVIYVSDNESWSCGNRSYYGTGTSMANEWLAYKARNPKAKLVCIDLAVAATTQAQSGTDVLNIGGFSDSVWEVIQKFVEGTKSSDHWVDVIEQVTIPELPAKA